MPKQQGPSLSDKEIKRIAPNLDWFLWRPILAQRPKYTQYDLKHWVTIDDVLDAHEALDLEAAFEERAQKK